MISLSPLAGRGESAAPAPSLLRHAPVRPYRSGNVGEGAIDEFRHQKAAVVDRSRHARPYLRNSFETDTAVIDFVTDQHHETVPLGFGLPKRAIQQRAADTVVAKRRLDRQRPQHQSLGIADAN